MPRLAPLLSSLVCLLVTACATEHCEVDMRPAAGGLRRTVRAWRESSRLSLADGKPIHAALTPERRAQVEVFYGSGSWDDNDSVFERVFPNDLPGEFFGKGRYDSRSCSLGSQFAYVERLGGTADPLRAAAERTSAVEMFTALMAARLRQEPDAKALEPLARDIETRLRADYLSALEIVLGRLCLTQAVVDGRQPVTEAGKDGLGMGGLQLWAVERGIARDLFGRPWLLSNDEASTDALLQACLVRHPHIRAPAWLVRGNADALEHPGQDSEFLGSAAFRRTVEGWNARRWAAGLTVVDLTERDDVSKALFRLAGLDLELEDQEVTLRLHTRVAPTSCNGRWEPERGVVTWQLRSSRWVALPVALVVHAEWVVPDEAAQKARFGKVVLDGDHLDGYVTSFHELTTEQRRAWEAAVATLTPARATPEAVGALLPWTRPQDDPFARDPFADLRLQLVTRLMPAGGEAGAPQAGGEVAPR